MCVRLERESVCVCVSVCVCERFGKKKVQCRYFMRH